MKSNRVLTRCQEIIIRTILCIVMVKILNITGITGGVQIPVNKYTVIFLMVMDVPGVIALVVIGKLL